MVSFLYFDGFKIKDGRSPGIAGHPVRRADRDVPPGQRLHRQPAARAVEDRRRPRVRHRTCSCRRSTRYYNTGFILDPDGRARACRPGRNFITAQSYGSVEPEPQRPPAEERQRRRAIVHDRDGRVARHQVRLRLAPRRTRSTGTLWPGNGILALTQTPTNLQAQVFREGSGGNRANYLDFYVGDTISHEPHDDRSRPALRPPGRRGAAERHAANPAFPNVVPGVELRRLRDAVHLEQLLAARRPHLRARRRRARPWRAPASAATPASSTPARVGVMNPSSTAGSAVVSLGRHQRRSLRAGRRSAASTSSSPRPAASTRRTRPR